jgi:sugar (pentulose or hexulose) kinase
MYACLEGVNLRLNAILSLIQGVVCNNESSGQSVLVASGNALEKNLLWRQMLADCTGMGIVVDSDAKEGTSRGVAMLVARCLRKAEDSDDLSDNEPLVVESEAIPNPSAEARWKRAILKQESLLNAVSMTWNADLAIETYDKSL